MTRKSSPKFSGQREEPAVRRNWGYWDGKFDRERGKTAIWAKPSVYRCAHPFDAPYGDGYWTGYYGEPAPKRAII